jgi:PIN domain nuclease of toxin-antitoxin system
MLLGEAGGDKVKAAMDVALVCAVNLAEVASYYAKLGASHGDIETMLRSLPIRIVPANASLSY